VSKKKNEKETFTYSYQVPMLSNKSLNYWLNDDTYMNKYKLFLLQTEL